MTPHWRLIEHGSEDGAWNMAVDRAVLALRDEDASPPTLRLYRWRVPTVTLGRFQKVADVDLEACRDLGLDVVRRPTGGRGVLHDCELTYSVVAGMEDGVPRGTTASYVHLCSALVAAYRRLGVEADLTARDRGTAGAGACYLHSTRADLSLGAAKLSGSAQVWARASVLQHGSFVVARDGAAESRVFHLDARQSRDLAAHTATIVEALGREPEWREVRDAVVAGFEEALGIELIPGDLTAEERALAEEYRRDAVVPEYALDVR